jgi:hypothetical protein
VEVLQAREQDRGQHADLIDEHPAAEGARKHMPNDEVVGRLGQ